MVVLDAGAAAGGVGGLHARQGLYFFAATLERVICVRGSPMRPHPAR